MKRSKILLEVIDWRDALIGTVAGVVKAVNLPHADLDSLRDDDVAACFHDNGTAGEATGLSSQIFFALVFRAKKNR